jgi:hypothetical protein
LGFAPVVVGIELCPLEGVLLGGAEVCVGAAGGVGDGAAWTVAGAGLVAVLADVVVAGALATDVAVDVLCLGAAFLW